MQTIHISDHGLYLFISVKGKNALKTFKITPTFLLYKREKKGGMVQEC